MSIVYLWLHDERADRLAEASAEVGLVFLTVVLTTGPIWGKGIWGAWWVWWDMRLTLTLFLWFVVAAYLVLRGAIEDDAMRARYSAVLGVLGALLIPFIHLSVYLFQARLHPMPVVLKPGEPSMSPEMLMTFLSSFVVFTLLCIAFIRARYRLGVLRDHRSAPTEDVAMIDIDAAYMIAAYVVATIIYVVVHRCRSWCARSASAADSSNRERRER